MSDLANRLVDVLTELLERGMPDGVARAFSEDDDWDSEDLDTRVVPAEVERRWREPECPFEEAFAFRCLDQGRSSSEDA